MIKSIGLNLALIIRADFNSTTLQKDNISRFYSPKATLVNPKIIIDRNPIWINHIPVITAVRRAI